MIVLEILHGTAAQALHRIPTNGLAGGPGGGGVTTIGRSPDSTVVITDFHLSGDHAQISRVGDHYVFRDLRSTNGSAVERDGRRIPVDATSRWELALADGDLLLLGNHHDPVKIGVRIGDDDSDLGELGERLIASRSIMNLPAVADQLERDPGEAVRVYKALQPLGARLEPTEAIEAVIAAAFQLLPRATHTAILLRSDSDKDRFSLAVSRERGKGQVRAPGADPVRASRAVLRRVLADRAAVLTANAQEALSSESILGGQILSILALPLWRGDDIIGLIQADNRASVGMFSETDLEVGLLLAA
ncbi:MAG TPA: FHA domain-containing protein, partial [Kofleriaceae bacterium]